MIGPLLKISASAFRLQCLLFSFYVSFQHMRSSSVHIFLTSLRLQRKCVRDFDRILQPVVFSHMKAVFVQYIFLEV